MHSTTFGVRMVLMKAVSRLLPLTRWTKSGSVGATKLCSSLAVLFTEVKMIITQINTQHKDFLVMLSEV